MIKYISDLSTLRVYKVEVLQELQCPSNGLTYLVHINNRAVLVGATMCIKESAYIRQKKIDDIKKNIDRLHKELEELV